MNEMSSVARPGAVELDVQRHSWIVRLTHWGMALAILIMVGSGWRIYDWSPVFSFVTFPFPITLGGDVTASQAIHNEIGLASALLWHFAGMWLLFASFAVYVLNGIFTGHFRRDWFPIRPRQIVRDFVAAVTFRLDHRLGHYNAVQKALYLAVALGILVMLLSGLAIWKPVQFGWLTALFGGFEGARIVHFLVMSGIVVFVVVHVALVVLVPKTLVAMVTGRATAEHHEVRR